MGCREECLILRGTLFLLSIFGVCSFVSLIDRFQALFRPRQTEQQPATVMPPPPRPSAAYRLFAVENGRRPLVEDCRRMVEEDTRAEGVLRAVAKDIVKGGFELQVEGPRADEAKAIADELLERIDFWGRIDDWVRLTLQDGDTFLELGATSAGDIVQASRKPTLEMHRWSDEFDQFYDAARAFWWADIMFGGAVQTPPADATFFAEWQIIHARYGHNENSRYGRPLFASARKAYKRMTEGELDIAIRRKTRAGMKYSHSMEDASEADIQAYMERNKAALDDPFAAVADFFSNKRTTIQAIQGDAHLSEIDDVNHHIRTWWIAAPAPMSLLGYGQDLNRDVLDEQKEQYDSTKEELSNWVTEDFVAPLIERQWLLKGIWPQSLTWSAQWASKQPMTAPDLESAAKALTMLGASGKFTDETLLRLFSRFVPHFAAEAEIEALAKRMQDELARVAEKAQTVGSDGNQPA